jgi:hypothetical protein
LRDIGQPTVGLYTQPQGAEPAVGVYTQSLPPLASAADDDRYYQPMPLVAANTNNGGYQDLQVTPDHQNGW